jgi:hypothetical protein
MKRAVFLRAALGVRSYPCRLPECRWGASESATSTGHRSFRSNGFRERRFTGGIRQPPHSGCARSGSLYEWRVIRPELGRHFATSEDVSGGSLRLPTFRSGLHGPKVRGFTLRLQLPGWTICCIIHLAWFRIVVDAHATQFIAARVRHRPSPRSSGP